MRLRLHGGTVLHKMYVRPVFERVKTGRFFLLEIQRRNERSIRVRGKSGEFTALLGACGNRQAGRTMARERLICQS